MNAAVLLQFKYSCHKHNYCLMLYCVDVVYSIEGAVSNSNSIHFVKLSKCLKENLCSQTALALLNGKQTTWLGLRSSNTNTLSYVFVC